MKGLRIELILDKNGKETMWEIGNYLITIFELSFDNFNYIGEVIEVI